MSSVVSDCHTADPALCVLVPVWLLKFVSLLINDAMIIEVIWYSVVYGTCHFECEMSKGCIVNVCV